MYRRSIAVPLWPVCSAMTRSGTPSRSSRGRKTGPQRVTGHLAGVEPGPGGVALQHERHRLAAESCCADVAMAVHGAKGGSLGDA